MQTREELYQSIDYYKYEEAFEINFKVKIMAKKSVALSGVEAGNTSICTVGRNGNDLHYRGYDIADLATNCQFEEVVY
jgi:2-methylcitrate synthase